MASKSGRVKEGHGSVKTQQRQPLQGFNMSGLRMSTQPASYLLKPAINA